jgi:hypothetical protein
MWVHMLAVRVLVATTCATRRRHAFIHLGGAFETEAVILLQ